MADKARILVADDNRLMRKLFWDILTEAGYHVVVASDGEEALGKVRLDPPDLILVDILMPKRNGIQVAQELKSHPATSGIPIIIITSLPGTPGGQVSRADLYLQKPVRPDLLLHHVRTFLVARGAPEILASCVGQPDAQRAGSRKPSTPPELTQRPHAGDDRK